jgi:hypothetical protein
MIDLEKNAVCLDKLILDELLHKLISIIPDIVEVIMTEYNSKLVGIVRDKNSKAKPELYYDDLKEYLLKFIEVTVNEFNVNIKIPDMDNFKFSGNLNILKNIFEGTAGIYAEVSPSDYEKLFGKRPLSEESLNLPSRETIYLVRYDSKLAKLEREKLKRKLTIYPFSNTPPIDILKLADKFYEDNINKWMDDAVEIAKDRYEKECF